MSLPVVLEPEAEEDIERTRDYLEQQRAGTGATFLARVRELLERVEAMPELYAVLWQDVRAARLRRFPFVVYYRVLTDRVKVVAVMHGSRDWSAWQGRV